MKEMRAQMTKCLMLSGKIIATLQGCKCKCCDKGLPNEIKKDKFCNNRSASIIQ